MGYIKAVHTWPLASKLALDLGKICFGFPVYFGSWVCRLVHTGLGKRKLDEMRACCAFELHCFRMKKICCVCCAANGGAIGLQEKSRPPSLLSLFFKRKNKVPHYCRWLVCYPYFSIGTVSKTYYLTNCCIIILTYLNAAKLCFLFVSMITFRNNSYIFFSPFPSYYQLCICIYV